MEAGKKLDALIAKKVFGCKIRSIYAENISMKEYETLRRHDGFLCGCELGIHNDTDDYGVGQWLKEYSKDIKAAWEVVEAMRYQHGGHLLELYRNGDDTWYCRFSEESKHAVTEDEAPLAICAAALRILAFEI